jgi:hypothetical protein
MVEQKNVVDFVGGPGKSGIPNIIELVDSEFLISGYEMRTGKFDSAIIDTNLGSRRTSSKVLIDQLKGMDGTFKSGKQVRVRLVRMQNFYTSGVKVDFLSFEVV